MTNDSKLGMAAGVAGVIVAAVLLSNNPPPAAQSKPGAGLPPKEKLAGQPQLQAGTPPPVAVTPVAPPEASDTALPSTPVARTRKDVDAQPASLASGADEEP
jgi:hypothetical protein